MASIKTEHFIYHIIFNGLLLGLDLQEPIKENEELPECLSETYGVRVFYYPRMYFLK